MERGSFVISLRTNQKPKGEYPYYDKNVTIYPLSELLDKYLGQRLVHFITIDLEGFEYSILEELFDNNGKLSKQGIVFCQIDAELHQLRDEHGPAIKRLIEKVSHPESDYLPVNHRWYMKIHHKITFINFGNRECRRAFDYQKLFD